jgi:putative FmdB family regulatory protein
VPLYDYECLECGERFETLVRNSITPSCPGCQGRNLKQLISMFAVDSEGIRQSNIQAARRHNSKAARDKAIADRETALHHED